jgi:hypothetical protein
MAIRLTGYREGVQALQQLRNGAGQFSGVMLRLGSPLIYAWGVETGYTRTGRVARKAGPARYLQGGLESIQREAPAEIVGALPKGAGAVNLAIGRLGRRAQQRAQQIVPVRSGALRASIRSVPKGAA